ALPIWKDDEVVDRLELAGVGQCRGEAPADGKEGFGERERARGGGVPHAGKCAQLAFEVAHPGGALPGLRAAAPAESEESQQAAGVETGIDALQFNEAARHEPAGDQY